MHNSERLAPAEMGRNDIPPSRGNYRPEIDGLRAVSILAVVMYHAGVPRFEAGYLGVDIFFVISGFLITDQLLREAKATGTIEMAAFYARRVRRLLPAFLAMALGTTVLALIYLVPITEQRLFGNALARSAALYYNIALWRGGYVYDGADAGQQLLTHTWSLAVEEQFYLIWPWICILALRIGRPLVLLSTLTLSSLIGSSWFLHQDANATFFLLPFRVWELGLGACVAAYSGRFGRAAALAAPAGAPLVLGALFAGRSPAGTLPAQVLAVLGAALIVARSDARNPASRLLSLPPMVFVGRMSYAWYLWHWPLLVIARLSGAIEDPAKIMPFVITGFLLGAVTQSLVEAPIRRMQITRPVRVVVGGLDCARRIHGLWSRDGTPGGGARFPSRECRKAPAFCRSTPRAVSGGRSEFGLRLGSALGSASPVYPSLG